MPILVELNLTEDEFILLEEQVKRARRWLDAGCDMREGRGDKFVASVLVLDLRLTVWRDDG